MASKEVKNILKEARNAIKNKEFQQCLQLSRSILEDDPENYMAFIFIGLSSQELGFNDQVPIAFKKAIKISSSNVLAWNGLANYYEKLADLESHKELLSVYTQLLTIERNDKKINEICEKITGMVFSEQDVFRLITALVNIAKSSDFHEETISLAWLAITSMISQISVLPSQLVDTYIEALSHVISIPKFVTRKYYNEYLTLLYKQKHYSQVFEESSKMFEVYNSDVTPLEWICKVYNELVIEDNLNNIYPTDKIWQVCDKLLNLQSDSSMGLFTKGVLFYEDKKYFKALDLLNNVTHIRPGLLHAWILLSDTCLKLYLYSDALQAALKADKLLLSINNTIPILRKKLDFLLLESLSCEGDHENLQKAVNIGKKLDYEDVKITKCLVRCYTKMESFVEAKTLISKLMEVSDEKCTALILTAQLLHKEGKLEDALKLLEENESQHSSEWWFEIALLNWELCKFDQSLLPLLKATKLDQNYYMHFLYLGHYYRIFNNADKAKRCYEKAFRMNPKCIEAAVELTKLFRLNKNWDANVTLLQSLTGEVPDVENEWAWIQLGLNYLAQEEYSNAIEILRYVLRINPNNSHCWESLGDAYMGRGAYTSALKSYQKASELSNNLLYPFLQIANIRRTLGEYMEAKQDFEEILRTNKSYVPALKGLAETCLLQARQYKRNYLFGSARDYAQIAFDALIIGIEQHNNLSCLWKLAADCCFLVACLPDRYCCMLVLASFIHEESANGNKILGKDELFILAERLYYKTTTLIQDCTSVWYDLSICFLVHARSLPYNKLSEELYSKAANIVQYCINLNPTNGQNWNLKGLIAVSSGEKNYALAQHSFIKAIVADDHSAIAWCNLGVLYLILEDFQLANKAFAKAQSADPNFVNCWIGQALVAENLCYNDAMDLFRHSTQLAVHPESCIGYGHWVCKTILNTPQNTEIYSIHNMHTIPLACDALTWYTDNNPDDACAWNMLGILREEMGLKDSAAQAFRSAFLLCEKALRDKARVNYARLLYKQQKYKKAIDVYKGVGQASFDSGSGLALALFKDQEYEESYEAYKQALDWLTEEQTLQSELLVALASIAYMCQGPNTAKTLLLQSTELKSSSPYGLYATLAVGLLHKDKDLSKLTLIEICNRIDDPNIFQHYVELLIYTSLLQGNHQLAVKELSRFIHKDPSNAFLWLSLSNLLIRIQTFNSSVLHTVSKASQRALKLGLNGEDTTKVWCIISIGSLLLKDYKEALKMAQHAAHCYPHLAQVWAALIAATVSNTNNRKLQISDLVKHVKEHLQPSESLLDWLNRVK